MPKQDETIEDNRMTKLGEVPLEPGLQAQLDELLAYKQDQLVRLNREVTAEHILLTQTKEQIREVLQQQKYDQEIERKRFLEGLEQERFSLRGEQQALEALRLDLESLKKESTLLEERAGPIRQELKRLMEERLAIEAQRLRNEELRCEADELSNAATASQEQVAQASRLLSLQQTKVTAQAQEQEQREARLRQQRQEVDLQLENLRALQKTLDPKLIEVTTLAEQAEKDRTSAEVIHASMASQQAELDKQRSDLAILSSRLEAKSAALIEYDTRLKYVESELRIKTQQALASGLKVSEVPAHPVPSEGTQTTP